MKCRSVRVPAGVSLSTDAWFKIAPEDIDAALPYMGDEIEDWDTVTPLRPAHVPHVGVFSDLVDDALFWATSSVGDRIAQEFATPWAERLVAS